MGDPFGAVDWNLIAILIVQFVTCFTMHHIGYKAGRDSMRGK